MVSLEMKEVKGFDFFEILNCFDDPFRTAIWESLSSNHLYISLQSDVEQLYVIVTGRWLRKFIGHVAIEMDVLSDFRRKYPPILDRDLVFIQKF